MNTFVLDRRQYLSADLLMAAAPRFSSPNKKFLYDLAFAKGIGSNGAIGYSRWNGCKLPATFCVSTHQTEIVERPGFFDYAASIDKSTAHWHLNFANKDVFFAWATSLLAQDELQVVEHPILIPLRLSAGRQGVSMLCNEEGTPMPILFTGVMRSLHLDTAPSAQIGRHEGLYGHRFTKAKPEHLLSATTVFERPLPSNILAIEAPLNGTGTYTNRQIDLILSTALSGFKAAANESQETLAVAEVAIHTGFWGCGAYGGNRVLMALLQMIAAQLAGIDQLIFHTGDPSGNAPFYQALQSFESFRGQSEIRTDQLVQEIVKTGYKWGISDGN